MTQEGGPGTLSDRELVLAFQAGDRAAYDELYRRYHDRVARVCYRFLNNRPDAEEAAQETFLKAFQALHRFNGQFQVGAWLARIATNVCVDHLRVKSRSHLVSLPTEITVAEQGPEELLVGDHPRLDVAIQEIQPLHADALKMRALDGMSHVEIAGRLSMTPAQAKALLHRARTSFKKAWDKAQGWLVLPIFGTRSLDRSPQVSQMPSNVVMFAAQAPALAEKAAASVLIVMAALTGLPSTPATPSAVDVALPQIGVAVEDGKANSARRHIDASTTAAPVVAAEATSPEDPLIVLPETLTSALEGHHRMNTDDDGGDPTSGAGEGDPIPPTVKESPKKAKEVAAELLETIDGDS